MALWDGHWQCQEMDNENRIISSLDGTYLNRHLQVFFNDIPCVAQRRGVTSLLTSL
jgi:hypothetical protein